MKLSRLARKSETEWWIPRSGKMLVPGVLFATEELHGAGRTLSRHEATRRWKRSAIVSDLASRGIYLRSPSLRGPAEEAPGAQRTERVDFRGKIEHSRRGATFLP